MAYCMNCGKELPDGAKFCAECGTAINAASGGNSNQRKTVYDGEIHKCPNCGNLLDAFDLNCKICGYELRGNSGSSVVQNFAIEINRLQNEGGENPNKRIATYISTFPIPNSKSELLEFLCLSGSNINLKNYGFGASELSESERVVSDAYYQKFLQAYRKAQVLFGNTSDFSNIETVYRQITKEITSAKRKRVFAILAIVFGGISLFAVLITLCIFSKNS